jgi:hypothetical protein
MKINANRVLAVLVVLSAGCGDVGVNTTNNGGDGTPTTAPTVTLKLVQTDAAELGLAESTTQSELSVTSSFSAEMHAESTEDAISVTVQGNKVGGVFSWSDDRTTLTFTPSSDPISNTIYDVKISTDALSAEGMPLVETANSEFTAIANGDIRGDGTFIGSCDQPGVVLTFDDLAIDAWYSIKDLLRTYGAKATFFVTYLNGFTNEQIQKFHKLNSEGHEIAAHGLMHKDALDYEKKGLIDEYVKTDIIPAIDIMKGWGLEPKTFAYPGGHRNSRTDSVLFNYFSFLRYGVSSTGGEGLFFHCFPGETRGLYSLWIDNGGSSIKNIIGGMQLARQNSKIIVLIAHTPANSNETYVISLAKLEAILKSANEMGLKFYTFSELGNIP